MLRQASTTLFFDTRGRGLVEITRPVAAWGHQGGMHTGLLTLFIRHTSASLVVQENADPEVRSDLDRFMSRLVVDGDAQFRHTDEGPDDMPAHVRAALTAVQLSIPLGDGVSSSERGRESISGSIGCAPIGERWRSTCSANEGRCRCAVRAGAYCFRHYRTDLRLAPLRRRRAVDAAIDVAVGSARSQRSSDRCAAGSSNVDPQANSRIHDRPRPMPTETWTSAPNAIAAPASGTPHQYDDSSRSARCP